MTKPLSLAASKQQPPKKSPQAKPASSQERFIVFTSHVGADDAVVIDMPALGDAGQGKSQSQRAVTQRALQALIASKLHGGASGAMWVCVVTPDFLKAGADTGAESAAVEADVRQIQAMLSHGVQEPAPAPFKIDRATPETALIHVFQKTLESFNEVRLQTHQYLSEPELIRQVADRLIRKAAPPAEEPSVEAGWQALLERGLQAKAALLRSAEFKSTDEAGKLLGIGEPAVRKRIRERKLFALKSPGEGDFRIPAWALDPAIAGPATAALLAATRGGADEWQLYHFMTTPDGSLNGLKPFECLLSNEHLPSAGKAARGELVAYLQLGDGASLLQAVKQALLAEVAEIPRA
jgi:hypothetical protein